MKLVLYIDTDPWYGEYVIVREGKKYYYAYINYENFEVAEIEEINEDVEKFAWEHGLMKIDLVSLEEYLNELKSLFES